MNKGRSTYNSKCINELEFIFTKCTFLQTKDETIKFENVDVAIVGVVAITAGGAILNNVAALVGKSMILRSHYLTVKRQKMELEQAQRNQDEKE